MSFGAITNLVDDNWCQIGSDNLRLSFVKWHKERGTAKHQCDINMMQNKF